MHTIKGIIQLQQKKEIRHLHQLLQTAREDHVIKNRLIELLQLSPGERRMVLNNWIETYWLKNTGPEIIQALAYLFDDKLASETLKLINRW
jgi:hypothetical protein